MPFNKSQFTDYIVNSANSYASQFGLNPPASDVPDQGAAPLFSSHNVTMGVANLTGSRKGFYPMSPYPWISGHPNQDMYGGNNWQRVCMHDAAANQTTGIMETRRGNCIAITQRHLLMLEHGSDPENGTLQWMTANNQVITRTSILPYVQTIAGTWPHTFRMAYLSSDLPKYCVCPLLDPNDAPVDANGALDLTGVPAVSYNNFREATCWEIEFPNRDDGTFVLKKPTNATLAKLWRPFAITNSPYGTPDRDGTGVGDADAGSGSPFFLVFTNSVGQTQFVYWGHTPSAQDKAFGPSFLEYFPQIMQAVNTLNSQHGGTYQPVIVTNTDWSSILTRSLVSYWKLNETSGNRADSHGSHTLTDNNTVGSTSGWVYPLAAEFFAENGEFLENSQPGFGFPRSITISAWVLLRDYSPNFSGVITKDGVTANRDWSLSYNNGYFEFGINGDASTVVRSPFVQAGQWSDVLAWWDERYTTMGIRLNNGPIVTKTLGLTTRNNTQSKLVIGGFDSASSRYPFDGRIGPVAIWSRPLTPQEQDDVSNYGAGAAYPFPAVNY